MSGAGKSKLLATSEQEDLSFCIILKSKIFIDKYTWPSFPMFINETGSYQLDFVAAKNAESI